MVFLYHPEQKYSFLGMGLQNCFYRAVQPNVLGFNPTSTSCCLCDPRQQFNLTVLICEMGMVRMIILSTQKRVAKIQYDDL